MQKNRHFRTKVIAVRQKNTLFLLLCLLCIATISIFSKIPTTILPTEFLVRSIQQSILAFRSPTKTVIRLTPYDILEDSILSIKASDLMQKKYAARYGGIFKTEKKELQKQENVLPGNILETDISANGLTFINTPGVPVNAQALLETPLDFYPQDGAPRVLIVHTHTSEAYAESPNARNTDPNYNVISVGQAIKKTLTDAGIGVIHDTTQNDNPSYNQSYKKALTVIEKNLVAHPTIEVVLDIHRDYIKRDDGTLVKPTITTKSGKKAAQIMFVIGTDSMGLHHPNWQHNLAFSAKIQKALEQIQPGLCRSINIRTERFNQHATKGSMIIEVGTGANTTEEAILSGTLTGEAIAKVLLAQ